MTFFWPSRLRPEAGAIGRLGRLAHWVGLLWAAVIAGFGVYYLGQSLQAAWAFLIALAFAQAGRAVRYVLAGE